MPDAEPLAGTAEAGAELVEVGDDEARGRGRRRCAHVGREVAERLVLLVADRRHDGDGAACDRTDDPLVAEREQILEAAAAAGEDHDVDAGVSREPCECRDDRARRRGPCTRVSAITSRTAG